MKQAVGIGQPVPMTTADAEKGRRHRKPSVQWSPPFLRGAVGTKILFIFPLKPYAMLMALPTAHAFVFLLHTSPIIAFSVFKKCPHFEQKDEYVCFCY
jgi:hypothetical protein